MIVSFKRSISKKYNEALKLSSEFKNAEIGDEGVWLDLPIKEIFEKWDSFNTLFWIVIDWKGSYLEYEGMQYLSHTDKTKLFYALQLSKMKWINFVENKVANLYNEETGEYNTKNIDSKTADYLIDLYTIRKNCNSR